MTAMTHSGTASAVRPLETVYKNYRFRSRLEARWAVFFDALHIPWEYEKQGFDIGDGEAYLPDFYLPESDQWVEIKPDIEKLKSYRFYLAGSCNSTDTGYGNWRFQLINDAYRNGLKNEGHIFPYHRFIGPYLAIDNHSCSDSELPHKPTTFHDWLHTPHECDAWQFNTYHDCLEQIRGCDVFFAYLNKPDAYGTLAEMGYARALGKLIVLCVDLGLQELLDNKSSHFGDDLWFLKRMSNQWVIGNPVDGINAAYEFLNMPGGGGSGFSKMHRLIKGSRFGSGLVFYGQPGHGTQIETISGSGYASLGFIHKEGTIFNAADYETHHDPVFNLAVIAARQARFEYGQKGSPGEWVR